MAKVLPKKLHGAELDPAKFGQFEAALKRGLSTPPTHHTPAPKAKTRPTSKGRVHKGKTWSSHPSKNWGRLHDVMAPMCRPE